MEVTIFRRQFPHAIIFTSLDAFRARGLFRSARWPRACSYRLLLATDPFRSGAGRRETPQYRCLDKARLREGFEKVPPDFQSFVNNL